MLSRSHGDHQSEGRALLQTERREIPARKYPSGRPKECIFIGVIEFIGFIFGGLYNCRYCGRYDFNAPRQYLFHNN
jgi:hypothetical protein